MSQESKREPKTYIDKLALVEIQNQKVLVTLSKGKDVWYMPGGKREGQESDAETLMREVKEELMVTIDPQSITYYGTFEAQAHGHPRGVKARLTCYTASYHGTLQPAAEIEKIAFFSYAQKPLVGQTGQLIFDDLKKKDLIT
jgi:8-oxo-dGTP diphosphatase